MNPARIPLLWILLPWGIGIAVGRIFPTELELILYASSLLLILGSFSRLAKNRSWLLVGGIAIAGYAYTVDADRKNDVRSDLPNREATLSIEIYRLFEANPTLIKGLGRIISAERHLVELENARVYVAIYAPEGNAFQTTAEVGSRINATGVLKPIDSVDRQGGFYSYLKNSGVSGRFERCVVHSIKSQNNAWKGWLNFLLESASSALTYRIDENSTFARSYRAMLLGLKSELNDDQQQLFLESGALHLFAISGLHIGVIAACGHALFVLLRMPRVWIPIPNLIFILNFVLFTGGAPSAWRALLMITCYYLCVFSKRQSASLNALVLSAMICLLINPLQLFLAGFQMSYATVSSILLFGVPIGKRLCDRWAPFENSPRSLWAFWQIAFNKIGRFVLNSFAISISAFLASSALSIIYFNTLSFIGILTNIILLPLASLVIISGFLALVFAVIGLGPVVALFNNAALVVLWLMHALLEGFSHIDGTHITFADPSTPILFLLLTVLLVGMLYGYNRLWRFRARWLWLVPTAYTGVCILAASFG